MTRWARVKWSAAGQVARLPKADQADGATPEAYFTTLRKAGRLTEAAMFIGRALPRHETVAWAARAVRDFTRPEPASREDADALKAALLWVQDPSESRRRAAYDAAMAATDQEAEQLVALAAFFSGGSMAPEGCEPVLRAGAAADRRRRDLRGHRRGRRGGALGRHAGGAGERAQRR
jgi:hypothetical protein